MSSKTSLFEKIFSKAIIKDDFKRYWWAAAIEAVLYLLFVFSNLSREYRYDILSQFLEWNTDHGYIAAAVAFVLAGMLFSYLHKPSSVSFMHSIPVSRTQQYFSHLVSGIVLVILPIMAMSLIISIYCPYGAEYFYSSTVLAVVIFTLVSMMSMAVGNIFAVYIFSVGLIILPLYLYRVTQYVLSELILGYMANIYSPNINIIYLGPNEILQGLNAFIYPVYSIIFIIAGYFLYKFRNLENSREIVTFSWLRPIFMYIVAFCFCTAAFVITNENIILSFIIGVFTITATFMLIKKSITVKGIFKYMGVYVAAFAVISCIIGFDLTGFVHRIPNAEDIESARIINVSYNDNDYVEIDDSDDINLLLNLHKDILNTHTEFQTQDQENVAYIRIAFEYKLKNGSTMKRCYTVDNNIVDNNTEFFNSWAYAQYIYPSIKDEGISINVIEINIDNNDTVRDNLEYTKTFSESGRKFINSDKYDKFMEALKKDIKNIAENKKLFYNYLNGGSNPNTNNICIIINYNNDIDISDDTDAIEKYNYIYLTEDYTNTLEFLKENL